MEPRLEEVFRLLDNIDRGVCSFGQLLAFGDFIGVEWTLLYLRESFNLFDATEDSIINLAQFLRFCVDELNGLDILQYFVWKRLNAKSPAVQLCGGGLHRLHGLRLPYQGGVAKRSRCRGLTLQCFTSMPSYKVCTVSISDFLYLAEVGNAGWLHRSIWHPRRTIPIISAFSPRSTPHVTGTSVGTSSSRCLLFCSP